MKKIYLLLVTAFVLCPPSEQTAPVRKSRRWESLVYYCSNLVDWANLNPGDQLYDDTFWNCINDERTAMLRPSAANRDKVLKLKKLVPDNVTTMGADFCDSDWYKDPKDMKRRSQHCLSDTDCDERCMHKTHEAKVPETGEVLAGFKDRLGCIAKVASRNGGHRFVLSECDLNNRFLQDDRLGCRNFNDTMTWYRGTRAKTRSGALCQRWDRQSPRTHPYIGEDFWRWEKNVARPTTHHSMDLTSKSLSEHENYCRNPDPAGNPCGAWCYTVARSGAKGLAGHYYAREPCFPECVKTTDHSLLCLKKKLWPYEVRFFRLKVNNQSLFVDLCYPERGEFKSISEHTNYNSRCYITEDEKTYPQKCVPQKENPCPLHEWGESVTPLAINDLLAIPHYIQEIISQIKGQKYRASPMFFSKYFKTNLADHDSHGFMDKKKGFGDQIQCYQNGYPAKLIGPYVYLRHWDTAKDGESVLYHLGENRYSQPNKPNYDVTSDCRGWCPFTPCFTVCEDASIKCIPEKYHKNFPYFGPRNYVRLMNVTHNCFDWSQFYVHLLGKRSDTDDVGKVVERLLIFLYYGIDFKSTFFTNKFALYGGARLVSDRCLNIGRLIDKNHRVNPYSTSAVAFEKRDLKPMYDVILNGGPMCFILDKTKKLGFRAVSCFGKCAVGESVEAPPLHLRSNCRGKNKICCKSEGIGMDTQMTKDAKITDEEEAEIEEKLRAENKSQPKRIWYTGVGTLCLALFGVVGLIWACYSSYKDVFGPKSLRGQLERERMKDLKLRWHRKRKDAARRRRQAEKEGTTVNSSDGEWLTTTDSDDTGNKAP